MVSAAQAPALFAGDKPGALRGSQQPDGGRDGHDEPDDVQFKDVAAAERVGDHTTDDGAQDAQHERPEQPIFWRPGSTRRASRPMIRPAMMNPIMSQLQCLCACGS